MNCINFGKDFASYFLEIFAKELKIFVFFERTYVCADLNINVKNSLC